MKILAIESSCDETSAAVLEDGKVLSNVIATQEIHTTYGGVIPELASRVHIKNIIPVVDEALVQSHSGLNEIDAFAFAQSPGLLGSLFVGVCFAKSLALSFNKPLIAVNHIYAHISAVFISENHKPNFPFLCLTVSGGHTQIILCDKINSYKIIGTTIDDAAGEAFDKSAKLLGLNYPGGILIDKYANQGNENKFTFAKPKILNFDYSFSGLKTSILYFLQKQQNINPNFIQQNLNDICASIQKTIVDILLEKLFLAVEKYHIKDIALTGGVACNSKLRSLFINKCESKNKNCFIPEKQYCTDNAAMIAMNAYFKFLEKDFVDMNVTPSAKSVL